MPTQVHQRAWWTAKEIKDVGLELPTINTAGNCFDYLFSSDIKLSKLINGQLEDQVSDYAFRLVLIDKDRLESVDPKSADSLAYWVTRYERSGEIGSHEELSVKQLLARVYQARSKAIDFHLIAYSRAAQLAHFAIEHRYCGSCGSRNSCHDLIEHNDLDSKDNASPYTRCTCCSRERYPRISPCIIAIITNGDQILLAHASRHREGMYSAVAGFIESGENAEQAVVREVAEELGIQVKNVRYHSSACWPFPSQLMLGFIAEYDSGELMPDGEEILYAKWFAYNALPQTPPSFTIAGKLIEAFVKERENAV